jgi:DNA invertase Pin-like site-specific DNA recombinase
MAGRYTARRTNTRSMRLWPMAAEPGPNFRWGIVLRRSAYNRDGTEGSTSRQERAILEHLNANNLGRAVAVYTDIASAFAERARRPQFENALTDLRAGRIDGLIAWKVDRFVRRSTQYGHLLSVLESSGGRLATVVDHVDTASESPEQKAMTEIMLATLVAMAEMESESIGARVSLMHEDRARKGIVHSAGTRPFGHTYQPKHDADPSKADLGDQPLETGPRGAGTAHAKVVVDHRDLLADPAKLGRPLHQRVLAPPALGVGGHLTGGRLAHLDGRPALQMRGRDLGVDHGRPPGRVATRRRASSRAR